MGTTQQREALSDEHFSVDGTLIETWASIKSFQPKDGPKCLADHFGHDLEVRFPHVSVQMKRNNDERSPEPNSWKRPFNIFRVRSLPTQSSLLQPESTW
ncbi:hypothetical protein [Geotalea uraniireducens]|uniref:hypothetical protein n=1 Tax=Geotalea uraniireducens TaxID=351604 RepID=UPI00006BC87D|nr:hypothetical protein [Geotalea uraniireducens]